MSDMAGRSCPLRYRYGAEAIARLPAVEAETLYVLGGLYGNLPALDVVERLAAAESGPVTLIFNGDFNWFDVDDTSFAEINRRVLAHPNSASMAMRQAAVAPIRITLIASSSNAPTAFTPGSRQALRSTRIFSRHSPDCR